MNEQTNLKLTILKKLVKDAGGQITPEIIKLVEEITLSKQNSTISSVQKALELANSGLNNQEIIDSILNIPQPSIVQNSIRKVFSTILDPIKFSFAREMPRFVDSISYDRQIDRFVPRLIRTENLRKLSAGRWVRSVPEDAQDIEPWVINPEFKQMLLNGYKPADDKTYQKLLKILNSGDGLPDGFVENPFIGIYLRQLENGRYLTTGTPESEYTKNILDEFLAPPLLPAVPKEKIKVVITEQAGLLKDSLKNVKSKVTQDRNRLLLTLDGELKENSQISNAMQRTNNLMFPRPNWSVKYIENRSNNTYVLTIDKKFMYSSRNVTSTSIKFSGDLDASSNNDSSALPTLGTINANQQESLNANSNIDSSNNIQSNNVSQPVSNTDSGISDAAVARIAKLSSTQRCDTDVGSDLASAIMTSRINDAGGIFEPLLGFNPYDPSEEVGSTLSRDNTLELYNYFKENFDNIYSTFIKNTLSNINNNRLLKRFDPTAGFNLNSLDEDPETRNTLIVLNLLKFIPETPQELRDCGKELHPLNLDEIKNLMVEKFNEIGISPTPEDSTEDLPENAVTQSVSLAVALLLMRTMVFKYLLKNLVVFDHFKYDKSLFESPLTKEYLSIDLKTQLEKLGIYKRVEKTINDNYAFLKKNNIIKNTDETQSNITISSVVNGVAFQQTSPAFKNLISALLRKCVGYVKNLIGFKEEDENENPSINKKNSLDARLLNPTKIYDVFSYNNSSRAGKFKFKFSDIERFSDKYKNVDEEETQFFAYERYVKFDGFISTIFRSPGERQIFNNRLKDIGMIGIVSFQEFTSFINDFLKRTSLLDGSDKNGVANLKDSINVGIEQLTANQLLDTLFVAPKIGLRMSLVKREKIIVDNNYSLSYNNRITNTENFFRTSNSQNETDAPKVLKSKILSEKSYCFFDDYLDPQSPNTLIRRYYNCLTIAESEYQVNNFFELKLFRNVSEIEQSTEFLNIITPGRWWDYRKLLDSGSILNSNKSYDNIFKNLQEFFNKKKKLLIDSLNLNPDYELMTKKAMSISKFTNLISFYIDSALSNKEINSLFDSCKNNLKSLLLSSDDIDNYERPLVDQTGQYTRDINEIGNPSPEINLDLLWFIITTPILIFKGITQIVDPNIAIASQIVNAASAGLLFPKLDEEGNIIGYPGDPLILPTVLVSLALLPVNILAPAIGPLAIGPPVTPLGMIFWALEPLLWKFPWFLQKATESSAAQALSSNPDYDNIRVSPSSEFFNCQKDQDENS